MILYLHIGSFMPIRAVPLVNGEVYHIVNRGVNHQLTFIDRRDYQRALSILSFYRFIKPPIRFSYFNKLPLKEKVDFWKELEKQDKKLVSFLSFCLMPNHFHFLLRQEHENGISKFLANFQNSFTKYVNVRHQRIGHLLQGQFRAVRIETERQLLHTSRYIHLNPYTGYIVKTVNNLKIYPWSSLEEYIQDNKSGICDTKTILYHFKSRENYLQFILDQKDYQRTLDQIKHLVLE